MEDEGRVGDPRLFGKQGPIKLGWLRLLLLPQYYMVLESDIGLPSLSVKQVFRNNHAGSIPVYHPLKLFKMEKLIFNTDLYNVDDLPLEIIENNKNFCVIFRELKSIGFSKISLEEAKKDLIIDINCFIKIHKERNRLDEVLLNLGWIKIKNDLYEKTI